MRVCALIVSTATGIDPLARKEERRGSPELQYARALWVHLVVCEMGVDRGRASYLCDRSFESIERYLGEVEEWRGQGEFNDKLERWSEGAKDLLALLFDFTRLAPAAPSKRDRAITRAILAERAA